jgi:hypothetical protein
MKAMRGRMRTPKVGHRTDLSCCELGKRQMRFPGDFV